MSIIPAAYCVFFESPAVSAFKERLSKEMKFFDPFSGLKISLKTALVFESSGNPNCRLGLPSFSQTAATYDASRPYEAFP